MVLEAMDGLLTLVHSICMFEFYVRTCIYISMRNTTKLKTLLIRYTVSLDMEGEKHWVLVLTDKATNMGFQFEAASYAAALAKAYSHLLKELRGQDKMI